MTTKLQRRQLVRAARAYPEFIRAETAGDRVTLASLFDRGFMERRVWKGTYPNAAHEYRLSDAVADTLTKTVRDHDRRRAQ